MTARSIDIAQARLFASDIFVLAQQEGSKLYGTGTVKDINGRSVAYFERLSPTEASEDSTVGGPTVIDNATHSRRLCIPVNIRKTLGLAKEDTLRMIIDPRGEYATNIAHAIGRKMDDILIAALEGNATSVDNALGTSTVALTHTIDQSFGTTNSDIIVEKVIEASRILRSNEIPEGEEKFFVLDSVAYHKFIQEVELSSFDYSSKKTLTDGVIGQFMGFNFIVSERLSTTSEGFKRCLAYTKPALKIGLAAPMAVRMDERSDLNYLEQIQGFMSMGAVRMDESRVIAVEAYRA